MVLTRNPTGIDSLDPVIQGGFPSGSLVLLLGEIGAGDFEFSISSIARLLERKKQDGAIFPDKVIYISFTRSKEDIINEIAFSFPEFYPIIEKGVVFKDFSESFFARSFIPITWRSSFRTGVTFESLKWDENEENLISSLIDFLEKNAKNSVVVIDSLTILAQYCLERMEWKDIIMFLRGLQKVSKNWNGIIYGILTDGIFEKSKQEEIQDCMDGVMIFEWDKQDMSQRNRIMYLKKFRGVLSHLTQENIVNFEIKISSHRGFEVSNIKRVRGR